MLKHYNNARFLYECAKVRNLFIFPIKIRAIIPFTVDGFGFYMPTSFHLYERGVKVDFLHRVNTLSIVPNGILNV